MQRLIRVRNRSQKYSNARRDSFRQAAGEIDHLGAGASGIAKLDLFEETWHGSEAGWLLSQLGLKRDYIVSAYDPGFDHRRVKAAQRPEGRGEVAGMHLRVINRAFDFSVINIQGRARRANVGQFDDRRAYAKPLSSA